MINIQNASNQYLTFTISDEQYAMPVTHVREVLTVPKITHIPRMPDAMKGVINLRGSVVPIFDLKTKFGMGETDITDETAIIVIELSQEESETSQRNQHIGLYTDSVKKVISLPPDMIDPAPRIGAQIQTSFIAGMGHVDGEFIVILNIFDILTSNDLETVESLVDADTIFNKSERKGERT